MTTTKKTNVSRVMTCVLAVLMVLLYSVPAGVFTPVHAADSVTAELTAKKTLDGDKPGDKQFEFTIEAKDGAPMPKDADGNDVTSAKSDADGNISFGTATYTAAGTYEYTVKEVKGNDSNITYDTSEQTIKVVVTANDTTSSTAPDNGWDYTPTKHTWSTSGTDDGSTARNINFGTYSQGDTLANYTTKKTVNIEGVNEYVFCGANYKSASESSYNKVALFWAEGDASYKPWGVNWDGKLMSSTDGGNKQDEYKKWLDRVAFLYSKDYANIDSGNASGAWNTSTYPYVLKEWSLRDAVQKILWNAFPYNAAGFKSTGDDLYTTTQMALFFVLRNGGAYQSKDYAFTLEDDDTFREIAPNKDDFDALVKYALDGTQTSGYSFENYTEGKIETYVYWNTNNDGDVGSLTAQPLIGVYADYTPPAMTADVTSAEFKNTSKSNGGDKHTVKISKNELGGSEVAGAHIVVKKGSATVEEWDSTTSAHEFTVEAGEYTMTETVAPAGFKQVTTEIKFTVAADGKVTLGTTTVDNGGKISVSENHIILEDAPDKDNPDTESTSDKPSLKTTVSAGGKTASAAAAVSLTSTEAAKVTTVTDKVDYVNLVKGATYEVSGTLNKVVDGKATAIKTVTENKVADAENGSWTIEFKDVTLEPETKYVVFESAKLVKDASGNEVKDGDTITHADVNDNAQTIVVGEELYTDLNVTKTTKVKTATVGDEIPFTITITNEGNTDATNLKVTDVMGDNLEYVEDDSDGNNVGQNVNWTVPTVPKGGSVVIEITCAVKENAKGKLVNKVLIVDSTTGDEQEFDDSATVAFNPPPADDDDDSSDGGKTNKAAGTTVRSLARTSDEFNLGLWAALSAISGLAMVAGVMRRRFER